MLERPTRRGLITGLASLVVAAPAVARVADLMPVRPWVVDPTPLAAAPEFEVYLHDYVCGTGAGQWLVRQADPFADECMVFGPTGELEGVWQNGKRLEIERVEDRFAGKLVWGPGRLR